MSFRLFIYYCALVGAWMGVIGWALGRAATGWFAADEHPVVQDAVRGLCVGVAIALGLGFLDAVWNFGGRRIPRSVVHVAVAVAVGAIGGLAGGGLAQWLIGKFGNQVPVAIFFVFGWTLAGLTIGAALGALGGLGKLIKCTIGGGLGGFVGAFAAAGLRETWIALFGNKDPALLWSPTAMGTATLGMFIGLLVGATQVALKQAWLRVEAGFRPGREMILANETTTIGRAESCDVGLFGDPAVEKSHAQIVREGVRYLLEDFGSSGGTFVNDKKIRGRVALRSGDLIRVGKNSLRFSERKRAGT